MSISLQQHPFSEKMTNTQAALIGAGIVFALIAPFIYLFATGVRIFEIAPEFVAYRIGDAFSVIYHEFDSVHPVQGLPTALASQIIVRLMHQCLGLNPATLTGTQIYAGAFYTLHFTALLSLIVWFWRSITARDLTAMGFMTVIPLYFMGADAGILLAPEYWFGELLYLIGSFAILAGLRTAPPTAKVSLLLGLWIAIGAGLKITMLGIAPLLLLSVPRLGLRHLYLTIASAAASYVLLMWAYVVNPHVLIGVLKYQFDFFLAPNLSRMYSSGYDALKGRPDLVLLLTLAIAMIATQFRKRPVECCAALAWIAILIYLIWRRPHSSSIGSTATAATFLIFYFAADRKCITATGTTICLAALWWGPTATRWFAWTGGATAFERPHLPPNDIYFMPDNYMNAQLLVQAMMYNGSLGLHPVANDASGKPYYVTDGQALKAAVGDAVLLFGDERSISVAEKALLSGTAITWTRPADASYGTDITRESFQRLTTMLHRHGATVQETPFYYGRQWILGRATIDPAKLVLRPPE